MISKLIYGSELPTQALLVEIVVAGLVVVVSGWRLSLLADRVAEVYDLGGAWVGALLLATVTSLPEVVTGVTSVWVRQADMAFAAIFGSCSFNIVLIVLFNAFVGGGSILRGKGRAHVLSSSFGIVLMSLTLMGIMLVSKFEHDAPFAQRCEAFIALAIAVTYMLCMRLVFLTERAEIPPLPPVAGAKVPRQNLMPKVIAVSLVLVAAAWWLARTGDVLADHPIKMIGRPLGATVVGAMFLAIATSLPEIVTGLGALRLGNLDMALGNIFGSNMFNIFVVPMLKLASWARGDALLMSGPDFTLVQTTIAGVLPVLLTGVVVGGINVPSNRRVLSRFGVDSALIAAIYILGMFVIVQSGTG